MKSFTVVYRNPGHWDICQNGGRIFKIRGCPGSYIVENRESVDVYSSRTVGACMGYICDQLMFELIRG